MKNLLYVMAVILIIGWAYGYFFYSTKGMVHIFLVMALILVLLRLIRGKEV